MRINKYQILFSLLLVMVTAGCGGRDARRDAVPADSLGGYNFTDPFPFTPTGRLDTPRMASEPEDGTVHVVYLRNESGIQTVMYSRMEEGTFIQPGSLSQHPGHKQGGGFVSSFETDHVMAYWINVPATAGQLKYIESDDGGDVFNRESRLNERNEARWPCVLEIGSDVVSYFFIKSHDTYELVVNRNFSGEDEPTIDTPQGNPFHLQGFTDGDQRVWLAYFVKQQNANEGRIALLSSEDRGVTFERRNLFNDALIENPRGWFTVGYSKIDDEDEIIHVVYLTESPELTTVYYSHSTDGGESFTQPYSIMQSEVALAQSPVFLVNGLNLLYMTADADEGEPALRYVMSADGGETFSSPLTGSTGISGPETISGVMRADGSVVLVYDDLSSEDSFEGEQLYFITGTP